MAWVKCKYCGNSVDEKAVICTSCGTNQKTGKSLKAHNAPQKKSKLKFLLLLLLMTALVGGGIHIFKNYRTEISSFKSRFTGEKDSSPKTETKPVLKEERRSFPLAEQESQSAEQYKIYCSPGFSYRQGSSTISLRLRVRVDAPKTGDVLRLKVYQGKSPEGEYELIYDQTEKVKSQTPSYRAPSREDFLKIPEHYKKLPEKVRKRMLERRKQAFERMQAERPKVQQPPVISAIFNYTDAKFNIASKGVLLRTVLYDAKGNFIKEGKPTRIRLPQSRAPRSVTRQAASRQKGKNNPSAQYGFSSMPPSLNGPTIYPYFYGPYRTLKFASEDKDAFIVTSLSIDGIKYLPHFSGGSSQSITRRNLKTGEKKSYYSSSLNLNYPFGGQVEIKFKYKTASGKFKEDGFSFYLPPPPPLLRLKTDKQGKVVKISWDKPREGIDKSHFFELPTLSLKRNYNDIKEMPIYQQNTFEDGEVFSGEPVNYQLAFKGGVYKAPLWSSEKGFETYRLQVGQIQNPFTRNGVNITVPSRSEKAHPARIELLETSLCYENTGIAACKLMNSVLDGVMQEKDLVFYDRQSRDYIIDEKFFALSESLKKQFMIKEADYAIQIRDYSRQDGNGIELWLFKKKIEGTAATKSTRYWRIADINLNSDPAEMNKAVEKLIAKVRDTLEFQTCPDPRQKTIKPKNIICMPLRPVNQRFVVWNYAAICESLFLSLSEKSGSIKILSRDDWDQLFSERIRRFDKGHSMVDNMVREVLLTGRLWRTSSGRTYYFQACDAFSGEVLGAKVFAGRLNDVAMRLTVWLETLRLSNDIKVDLQISKFHQQVAKTAHLRPWRPRNDLIKELAPYISNPDKSWSVRKTKGMALRIYKASAHKEQDAFYSFVERQWKDGFRAKAVSMLEKDWKEAKNLRTGNLLSSYYVEQKKYRDALGLYDVMLEMDGCSVCVYKNYNLVKSKAQGAGPAAPAPEKTVKQEPASQDSRWKKIGSQKGTKSIDYSSTYTNLISGKVTRNLRTEISRTDALQKYYFVDRDKICAEWAPGQPCRTAKLAFSIPVNLLSEGVNSRIAQGYGVWLRALRMGPFETYNVEFLFRNWRWLPRIPYKEPNRYAERNMAAEKRQMSAVCKARIIVLEAGWNSIDPFSKTLNEQLSYTRLGYFFEVYSFYKTSIDNLYHYSKIRAFFELQKNPEISFPKFTFTLPAGRKAYVSQIRTGKDMIRYWALELAEQDRRGWIGERRGWVRSLKLYQLLALNYTVRHESNAVLTRIYRMIKSTPIPTSVEEYRKSPVGTDFLVFMACKKDEKAIKMLRLMLAKRGYFDDNDYADYTYALALSGNFDLAAAMAPIRGLGATTLRWLPKEILDKVPKSAYLIFGTRNDRAARGWLLSSHSPEVANQYFGKPPAEAYRDWKLEHFKMVEKLKNSTKKEK